MPLRDLGARQKVWDEEGSFQPYFLVGPIIIIIISSLSSSWKLSLPPLCQELQNKNHSSPFHSSPHSVLAMEWNIPIIPVFHLKKDTIEKKIQNN